MSFHKFEAQKPKAGKTVELRLHKLVGDPVLVVEHLGATNSEYWNNALARANVARATGGLAGKKMTAEGVVTQRNENREIATKFSVRGLKNVFHDDKSPATAKDIPAVVASLPDDVFDDVWTFVMDPNNFRDDVIEGDAEELAKK